MANNTGTLVIAPIRPQSESDSFPSAYANELKGGHHQVNKESERLNIPNDRLKDGMLVSVINTNKTYQYSGGTWIDTNFEFLKDIEFNNNIENNDILTYDKSIGKWINKKLLTSYILQTGETLLNSTGTTEFVIGDKKEERGIIINYTLSRTGDTINKYQIGTLYIIHDDINVKLSDEYLTTEQFKIVEFSCKFDGFDENNIILICNVENGDYPIKMIYHNEKMKF